MNGSLSRCGLAAGFLFFLAGAVVAETKPLAEDYTDGREFVVSVKLKLAGQSQTATGKNKATGLKLAVAGDLSYRERRLPPAGRDAQALRGVRLYDRAKAEIAVSGQTSYPRLRKQIKLIVAEGRREGIRLYSPQEPLFSSEIDLLQVPGDSLAALSLLPGRVVDVGETWKLDDWAMQVFTALEAVEKGQIECTAKSVAQSLMRVEFNGEVTGAIYGALTTINVSGHYVFDLKAGYLKRLELKQTEKRSIGTVSPGLDVEANVTLERSLQNGAKQLSDTALQGIPLEPNPASLLIVFDSNSWDVRLHHPRLWHLFKHEQSVAVFRLVEKGSLIAQCNVAQLKTMKPGKHTSEEKFLKDIQVTLGEKFQGVNSTERIKGDAIGGEQGLYLYRVESFGQSNGVDAVWIHYLVAAPDGRQMALIFTVGKDHVEKLAARDLELATSLEFLQPRTSVKTRQSAGKVRSTPKK